MKKQIEKINIFIAMFAIIVISGTVYSIASKYSPGETLNPNCSPGEVNCTVEMNTPTGIPSGAVMAFNLNSCPTGWVGANGTNGTPDLRGSFVRGMNGSVNGRDSSRTLASYQGDDNKTHLHSVNPPSTNTSTGGSHSHRFTAGNSSRSIASGTGRHSYYRIVSNTSAAGNHNHSLDIPAFDSASSGGSESRPKNIALLYCVKQ